MSDEENSGTHGDIEKLQSSNSWIRFEKDHVHDVYDRVADHFSETRYKPWPLVESFLKGLPIGSVGADLGCGNGKYLLVNHGNIYVIGMDYCDRLLEHAKEKIQRKSGDLLVGDHSNVPIRENSMDFVISIAVLHHFCTSERRKMAADEILRILKPKGKFMIFVWAFEQQPDSRRSFDQQDTFVSWSMPTKKYHKDLAIDAIESDQHGSNDRVYQRYYHVFAKNELESLLSSHGFHIDRSGYERDNWFVEGHKYTGT